MALAISHATGASSPALLEHAIGELRKAGARWPDQDVIVSRHQDARWTWRELLPHAGDVAAGRWALGLQAPRCVRFDDALPITVPGKIQKFEIRQAMVRERDLKLGEIA